MEARRTLSGMVEVRLTSADLAATITAIQNSGITLHQVRLEGELSVLFFLSRHAYPALKKLSNKRGDRLEILHRTGAYWTLKNLLKRPVLLMGAAILLFLSLYLPSRVLFIRVEGNTHVPEKLILEQAEACGIYFGASRRQIRSEKIKNQLLSSLPQLQWVGVNTDGCVAVIMVRERMASSSAQNENEVSSISASRDGVILSCTVTRGSGLCAPGQAVKAGEILISGYTDCGIYIAATQAEGEVMAATSRELEAIMPSQVIRRRELTDCETKISMIIGKKRINFYKDSGISDTSCVKIYVENQWGLPGGFELPIIWVIEKVYQADCTPDSIAMESAQSGLCRFAENYLREHMVAGSILNESQSVLQEESLYRLNGTYACSEMIGVRRIEKVGKQDERSD